MEKVTERIVIGGMTCGGCVRHVEKALVEMEGVEVRNVTIGSAEIVYDPATTTRETIVETIREEGYDAR